MNNELEDFLQSQGRRLDKETPDPAVLHRILKHMQEKQSPKHQKIFISLRTWQWAAACVILVIGGILLWVQQRGPADRATGQNSLSRLPQREDQKDSLAVVAVAAAGKNRDAERTSVRGKRDLTGRKQAAITRVKTHTPNAAKGERYAGLKRETSPASRIRAVNAAYALKHLNNDAVDALVKTLNTDPNANVRLAVLDGLSQGKQDSYVRKKLVVSLQKQQDPVVQIALINLLTGMGESGILEELDKIVKDDNIMKGVKDCAYASIFRLRSS